MKIAFFLLKGKKFFWKRIQKILFKLDLPYKENSVYGVMDISNWGDLCLKMFFTCSFLFPYSKGKFS